MLLLVTVHAVQLINTQLGPSKKYRPYQQSRDYELEHCSC